MNWLEAPRRALFSSLFPLAFIAALAACQPDVGATAKTTIAGFVVKGPVNAATVTAYSVNDRGRAAEALGTTKTAADGSFVVDVGGHSGPTLVCAESGTYTEEATGGLVDLGAAQLCALVDDQKLGQATNGVLITPFTSLHAGLTACLVGKGAEIDVPAASARAASRLNDFLAQKTAGFDFRTTKVFDVTSSTAPGLSADVWHGLLLAGLSESARQISLASHIDPGVRVTAATLSTALLRDIDDGACVFDGSGPDGVKLAQADVPLSSNTLRGAPQGLALGIEQFLRGERNKSGITVNAVKDLTSGLASYESDIFADDAAAPPTIAITEPAAGTVAGKPAITVDATDATALSDVSFIAPQALVGTGTKTCSTPSHCELHGVLNTGLFPPGPLTITARATNAAGVSADTSVTVTVNNALPQINVTSPSAGTVNGTVTLHAQASSAAGIQSFDMSVPSLSFLPSCSPPATTTNCDRELDPTIIDILWDTTTATEGPHTITFAATDTAGNTSFARVDVTVDNIPTGTVAGIVDLGSPVIGAAVNVVKLLPDGSRGDVIGSAVTDEHGAFQVNNDDYEGPLEAVASGGTFIDPSTGLSLSLRAGQELTAAVSHVAFGEAVVADVNAWTTLAATRARSTLAQSPSLPESIDFNANLIAGHLLRPGSLSLSRSTSADLLTTSPAPSDSAAILALAHAGLSRLAAQASIDSGGAPGQVTPVDVLGVLEADLSDGVLDGTDHGSPLFLDQQQLPLDSYTLRTTLADRIDAFVKNTPFIGDGNVLLAVNRNTATTITSDALSGPGLLYDDLAEDRSILFPADVPVRPFDHTAPTITLGFAAPNQQAKNGDSLTGTVAITATASDSSGVASFDVVTPAVPDLFSSVEDMRVEIDGSTPPNRAEVSSECGIDITAPPLSLPDADRQVCLCAEAADTVANSADAALCFTRPRPVVTTSVTDFIGPAVGGIDVHASGSFDLVSCGAVLSEASGVVGSANGDAAGASCDLHVPFTSSLADGAANLAVDVQEIGGAVTAANVAYAVDTLPPALTITSPAAGAILAVPPHVAGNVSDANLRSVTLDVTTSSTPIVSGAHATIGPSGSASFDPFVDQEPDGLRTIKVTAVDAAGNTTVASRTYTKDTTPPALAALSAADGDPLAFFQLTATTAFTASPQCSQFPFNGCVFNIAPTTPTQAVRLRTQSSSADTYRRWQHLAGSATTPSTLANPAAENRAPTLRLKTDPGTVVEARVDATCPTDADFANRPRATFTANDLGLVDIPIDDANSLTTSAVLLRNQLGSAALCMSMRPRDQAGNVGAVVHHFFKYEATPAPLFMVFDAGPYNPASFTDDVKSLDHAHDDKALSGNGQGTSGRVFSHAYLVSPSTTTSYSYTFGLSSGASPSIVVKHRETLQVSKTRAFNWCFTTENGALATDHDDQLVNPDFMGPDSVGSPPDNPFWYGSDFLGRRSTLSSWALYVPTGASLLGATARMEHRSHPNGELDATLAFSPASSYSTSSNTTDIDSEHTFTVPLSTVNLEAWGMNIVTGQPNNLLASGSTVSFTAGGSSPSGRNVLLLFRAPVPTNAITLRAANVLNGQSGTVGFNSSCDARNAAGTNVGQIFTLNDNHWVVTDAAIPGSSIEPAAPHPLLWVASGQFPYCDGTSSHDCRYGRYFDDYESASWAWPAGRSLTAAGRIGAVSGAPRRPQTALSIPASTTRTLTQEQ